MAKKQSILKRREHHVPVPKWFIYLRATQLIFAILCAGCAAYVTKELPWFETSDLMVFTGFASIIFAVYFILGTFLLPLIYNFWLILLFEIITLLFWAAAFLALGFEIAIVTEATKVIVKVEKHVTAKYAGHEFSVDMFEHTKKAGDVACILGAFNLVLFFVTLCTFSIRLRRFRKSGGKAFARRSKKADPTVLDGGDPERQIQTLAERPIQMSGIVPAMISEYEPKQGVTYSEVALPQTAVQH